MREIDIQDWVYAGEVPVLRTDEKVFIWEWRDHSVLVCDPENVDPLKRMRILSSHDVANPFQIPLRDMGETTQQELFKTHTTDSENDIEIFDSRFSLKQTVFELIQEQTTDTDTLYAPDAINTRPIQHPLTIPTVYSQFLDAWNTLTTEEYHHKCEAIPWSPPTTTDTTEPSVADICPDDDLIMLCKRSTENFILAETLWEGSPLSMSQLVEQWCEYDLSFLPNNRTLPNEEVGGVFAAQHTLSKMGILDDAPHTPKSFDSMQLFNNTMRD